MGRQATGSEPQERWKPVLSGDEAKRARAVLRELVAAIGNRRRGPFEKHNLPQGYPGMAVLLTYAAEITGDDGARDTALDYLAYSIEAMPRLTPAPGLHTGFTGVAWAIEHLRGRLLDPDDDCGLDTIDSTLRRSLERDLAIPGVSRPDYDLIAGLVGLGVYALDRLPRADAECCVRLIVDLLRRGAEEGADGITWHTPPGFLPKEQLEDFPNGYYNCGVAHGVPGIIGFLGRVHTAGIKTEVVRPLLDGAVAWLLAQENPAGMRTQFPGARHPDVVGKPGWDNSRQAWCYGDPGIAVVLLNAAIAVGDSTWETKAISIARESASKMPDVPPNLDGSFCHGTSGLVHIFNIFYQHTGEPLFLDAVRYWLDQTYRLQRPGIGVAGFQTWGPGPSGEPEWVDDPGILTGAGGIGLALAATLSEEQPAWGSAFLLPVSNRG